MIFADDTRKDGLVDIARQIAASEGPSGRNRDYLLNLATALRALGDDDPHVFALESYLR
ncbi:MULTISPECIES: gamma-glutamylcyclotransferase [unclassified Marinobacter]|uniref:gamma-glutamylcyclotransferase n=1 Tax=unclassified Marinobacter TaxID=83889 RepID=UPI001E2E4E42|nr:MULTISPECIES: gamma-glutamylcyclotransferase [unclassified Marinobacter]